MLEASCHEASSFITLTYTDENLPPDSSLSSRDLQLFMKRIRKAHGKSLRFFGVGEYGDETQRPHYHLALFGVGADSVCRLSNHGIRYDSDPMVDRCWNLGKTDVKPLVLETAAYICGYVVKKLTSPTDPRLAGRVPEFARMSRRPGIGAPAMESVAAALQSREGWDFITETGDVPKVLRVDGKTFPLGPYLTRLLRERMNFENVKGQKEVQIARSEELLRLWLDYVENSGDEAASISKMYREVNKQRFRNQESRTKMFSKQRINL